MQNLISQEFQRHAAWRREKAEEYPEDERNLEAAEIFDNLAESAWDCPDDIAEAFLEVSADNVEEWSLTCCEVGFYSAPTSAEDLITDFLSRMRVGEDA